MKIQLGSTIFFLLLASSLSTAANPIGTLMTASPEDQVPTRLHATTSTAMNAAQLDRSPAAMSWAIDSNTPLARQPVPFPQQSREYWVDASANELRGGFGLSTSARGAVIRLSPHADNPGRIDAGSLSIRANGRLYAGADALQSVADQDALQAAGMDVPDRSLVVKLSEALGSGRIELIVASATGSYLIHVFEPDSPVVMSLQAERDTALAGDSIRMRANISGASLDNLAGILSSPDGHTQNVEFRRQADGSYVADVRPDGNLAGGFGLWEVHAFANASMGASVVPRDARTAFAVSNPTARLLGTLAKLPGKGKGEGLTLSIGVQAAMASRYQLAGTLYGSTADGSLAPVAVAHSAAWLEPGDAAITLRFNGPSLAPSGLRPPYELRDLRLINQSDMSLIERRWRAARID